MTDKDDQAASASGLDLIDWAQWRGGVDEKLSGIEGTLADVRKDQKRVFEKLNNNSNTLAYWSGAAALIIFVAGVLVALFK